MGSSFTDTGTTSWVACERASELAPTEPLPLFWLAERQVELGARDEAADTIRRVQALLGHKDHRSYWQHLIRLLVSIGKITQATKTIAAATSTIGMDQARADVQTVRTRFNLPRKAARFGVTAALEDDYLLPLQAAHAKVDADDVAGAEAIMKTVPAALAQTPGVLTVACRIALSRRRPARARALCGRARRIDPGGSLTRYYSGLAAWLSGQVKPAQRHLQKAKAFDPDLAGVDDAIAALAAQRALLRR